jgi:hypothetical protein
MPFHFWSRFPVLCYVFLHIVGFEITALIDFAQVFS